MCVVLSDQNCSSNWRVTAKTLQVEHSKYIIYIEEEEEEEEKGKEGRRRKKKKKPDVNRRKGKKRVNKQNQTVANFGE